jgi:hypothetical protein
MMTEHFVTTNQTQLAENNASEIQEAGKNPIFWLLIFLADYILKATKFDSDF